MPEELFNKIIDGLSTLRYSHLLKLQRYNEPLALDLIYSRIRYARKNLKQAVIGLHSNGDFLTARKLQRLQNNDLDFLIISRYIEFSGSAEKQLKRAKDHCQKYLKNLGLSDVSAYNYGDIITYRIPCEK